MITEEHRANIVAANKARAGTSRKCPEGCTCNRHKAYYRGGSKKGHKKSEQARQNMTAAANRREYTDADRQRLVEQIRTQRDDPEWEAKRISALKKSLIGTKCPHDCTCNKHSDETRQKISEAQVRTWESKSSEEQREIVLRRLAGRTSSPEYALAPYMLALGYEHNNHFMHRIGRKFPDFIDHDNKRVYEYFGFRYHELGDDDAIIAYYAAHGWSCKVMWEDEFHGWINEHQSLVAEDHHLEARRTRVGKRPR